MQVTETLSEGLRREFSVVVPAADIEGRARAKLADIGKTIRIPGFRPGKVPVNLIRQRYGASVMAEVMQDAVNTAADQMIEERGLRPAGQPKIDVVGQPDPAAAQVSDLAFNVEMELLPEITAPDLAGISLTRLRSEPTGEAVQTMIVNVARQQREIADVTEDRGAETGDLLTVDFSGSVDGVPFDGGAGQDAKVEIGGSGFIPGFSEGMIGMRPGETRNVDVTFPADYQAEALAGKAAVFEVTAKALGRPVEGEPDDALAVKLGFETLDKLREVVTGQIQREYDQMARLRIKRELLDILSEKADFPAPRNLVETEFNAIWQRVEAEMSQGRVDDEDQGKDPEILKGEYYAIADRRVRLGLLLSEIGRGANIQVTQAELTQALRQEASRYPGQEMQVVEFFRKNAQAVEQLRGPIFEDKVVDYILEMANVEDRLVPPEELTLPPADAAQLDSPTAVQAHGEGAKPAPEAPEPDAAEVAGAHAAEEEEEAVEVTEGSPS